MDVSWCDICIHMVEKRRERVLNIKTDDDAAAVGYALAEQGILKGNKSPDYGAHMRYALRNRRSIEFDAEHATGLRRTAAQRLKGVLDSTVKQKPPTKGFMQIIQSMFRSRKP